MLSPIVAYTFFAFQVKSRTTAECVERYYHVVKRNRRQSRLPRRYRDHETDEFSTLLADSLNEKKSSSSSSYSSDDDATTKSKVLYQSIVIVDLTLEYDFHNFVR